MTDLAKGPLDGLIVLDLTRILAGPTATQLLGDLGATVIKIERPGRGDDTRGWGPPFLTDGDGNETRESAYYLSSNRNKRSVAVDISTPAGAALIADLAEKADILTENFKTGDLARRGLDYATLSKRNPRLVYCSITGFGQTGPYAGRAGYDFLVQGMGGLMSLTGDPDDQGGRPMKAGVGVADIVCGLYGVAAILAAIHARQTSGRGQHIDVALFDSQIAWLVNQGVGYLVDGEIPPRRGNAHPMIVPYDSFPAEDGHFIIAIGNDGQFARFCEVADVPEMADDPRFRTNLDRVLNRVAITKEMSDITRTRTRAAWIGALTAENVPCGPINDVGEAFADPQAVHRNMRITMPHPISGTVDLIGNPVKLSETPVTYRHPPPQLGADTRSVLKEVLGLDDDRIAALARDGALPDEKDHT